MKLKGLSLAVLLSTGCIFLAAGDGHASPVAKSGPLPSLIRQWAPQVRLHSKEEFFPSSVEDFMRISYMFYSRKKKRNGELASPKRAVVNSRTINTFRAPKNGNVRSGDKDAPGQFRLNLRGKDSAHRQGRISIKQGKNLPPVYVAVRKAATFYDIKYIFFYLYNGPTSKVVSGLGAHEGDFERITVRLRRGTNMLMGIYFTRHGSDDSKWHLPGDIQKAGTHPVVYSAKKSHGSYNKAGTYKRIPLDLGVTKIHFAADECNNGYNWNTWQNIIDVGTYDRPLNGQTWIRFNGRWGRYKDTGCFGLKLPWGGKQCLVHYPDENGSTNLAGKGWFHNVEEGGPR